MHERAITEEPISTIMQGPASVEMNNRWSRLEGYCASTIQSLRTRPLSANLQAIEPTWLAERSVERLHMLVAGFWSRNPTVPKGFGAPEERAAFEGPLRFDADLREAAQELGKDWSLVLAILPKDARPGSAPANGRSSRSRCRSARRSRFKPRQTSLSR